jgi:hypothetical protein
MYDKTEAEARDEDLTQAGEAIKAVQAGGGSEV